MDKFKSTKRVKKIPGLVFPITYFTTVVNAVFPKDLKLPFIVKPNALGSSVGVHIVNSRTGFRKAISEIKQKNHVKEVLIQEYIDDAVEISCGCLVKKNGTVILLPAIEIRPKKSTMFDYFSKYEVGGSEEITPRKISDKKISKQISDLASEIHKKLGCKTYSRSDFRVNNNKIFFI